MLKNCTHATASETVKCNLQSDEYKRHKDWCIYQQSVPTPMI